MSASQDGFDIVDVQYAEPFREFQRRTGRGIAIVPDAEPTLANAPAAGDFAKWMAMERPELDVEYSPVDRTTVLKSSDVWLPLVYLASDVTVQFYLTMALSYLHEKARGALMSEEPTVHLRVEYENGQGAVKRFHYDGDGRTLENLVKRTDLNKLIDD